jgi:glycosyltransferase involved in cell wall biosynthesis
MTLGLPCIVNNIDSLPEIAINYKNAFVVNFDDIQQKEHIATIITQALHTKRCDSFVVMSKHDMIEEYMKAYIHYTTRTNTTESFQNF